MVGPAGPQCKLDVQSLASGPGPYAAADPKKNPEAETPGFCLVTSGRRYGAAVLFITRVAVLPPSVIPPLTVSVPVLSGVSAPPM